MFVKLLDCGCGQVVEVSVAQSKGRHVLVVFVTMVQLTPGAR